MVVEEIPHIRWLIRNDMPAVLEIEQLCYPENAWSEDDFVQLMRQRNVIGSVITVGDSVCGFVIYEMHKSHLRIINLAVHPSCQRRRLGSQMVSKLQGKLTFERRTVLEAHVFDGNLPAHKFFAKCGFRCTGVEHEYFGDGSDAYRFAYDLLEWADDIPSKHEANT